MHHDNLRVVLAAASPPVACPSYPSVRRYLKAHGLTRKRLVRRGADQILRASAALTEREIRSYEVEYVLQLMLMRTASLCGAGASALENPARLPDPLRIISPGADSSASQSGRPGS